VTLAPAADVAALTTLVGVPAWAWWRRGRGYAIFGLVILAVALPGALVARRHLAGVAGGAAPLVDAVVLYGIVAAGAHLAHLVRARLRARWFRLGVSVPGMTFIAGGALAGVWLLALLPVRLALVLAGATDAVRWLGVLDVLPFAVALASIATSYFPRKEFVRVPIAAHGPPTLERLPVERWRGRAPAPSPDPTLRIVQISDPHLGPWQPVHRLRRRITELLAHEPDLVLLTGDFLTMEGVGSRGALAEALAPLRDHPGRCFAIFGNHDHESPHEVASALHATGVRLLVDDEARVDTPVGPVQIVGADYVGRGVDEHLRALLARFPRRPDHLRLLLLHDPRGFRHVAPGDVDLTLSGHTHGGQVGLVSFGIDWTVLKRTRWPDHGLFGHGPNRLYVHRGTGFYGFPLRVGVPGEASVLEVVVARG